MVCIHLRGVIMMTIANQLEVEELPQTDRQDWQRLREVDGRQYWQHDLTGTVAVI